MLRAEESAAIAGFGACLCIVPALTRWSWSTPGEIVAAGVALIVLAGLTIRSGGPV